MGRFTEDISTLTGEKINLLKVKCECGHVIAFLNNHYAICRHCGRKVYPTKKTEFKDKLLKEINKRFIKGDK